MMGEEYGEDTPFYYFVSHSDKELIELVREGRQKEFAGFESDSDASDPQDEKTSEGIKRCWIGTANRLN
jgi:maltooligosyltrehalose trehalohydrolase